jgi:predicted secreted protein
VLAFAGLNRFWAVREQYDTTAFRQHCRRLATAVAGAIEARAGRGEEVILVGVEGSPSMGVTITSSDPERGGRPAWPEGTPEHTGGEGIFVEELHAELDRRGIRFGVAGETHALAGHDPEDERARLEAVLDGGNA